VPLTLSRVNRNWVFAQKTAEKPKQGIYLENNVKAGSVVH